MKVIVRQYHSPCGPLLLGVYECKLCLCDWDEPVRRDSIDPGLLKRLGADGFEFGDSALLDEAEAQLDAYLRGEIFDFNLPLLYAGTPMQVDVWEYLRTVPYGATRTYAEVAAAIGKPNAVRAVAHAIGQNVMSIIVPCHRIIGADGSMRGYAGGLHAKCYLLDLERKNLQP